MYRLETLEIRHVLRELLDKRADKLALVSNGERYREDIAKVLGELDALPKRLADLPLVELLKGFDLEHDTWGRVIDLLLKVIELGPTALDPLDEAAALARKHYMTGPKELNAPYVVEAQRGADRLASLPAHQATLDLITTPDARPLSAWIHEYAAAGTRLGQGLAQRTEVVAAAQADPDTRTVQVVRGAALRIITDLRDQISLDTRRNDSLPKTLAADVLGYIDEAVRLAKQRARQAKPAQPAAAPTE